MEYLMNGDVVNGTTSHTPLPDGHIPGSPHEPPLEELERELPTVHDGQIPLGELVSRMAQAVYAELTELAET